MWSICSPELKRKTTISMRELDNSLGVPLRGDSSIWHNECEKRSDKLEQSDEIKYRRENYDLKKSNEILIERLIGERIGNEM